MPNPVGNIAKIQLPDGNQYNIRDTVSGYQKELIPGTNVTITESSEGPVISSTGGTQARIIRFNDIDIE